MPAVDSATGRILRLASVAALVFLLPLTGAAAVGTPLSAYLNFPPRTFPTPHPSFSLPVFLGLALLILGTTAPLLGRLVSFPVGKGPPGSWRPFPWWGWAGAAAGAAAWVLAWERFPFLGRLQAHTFMPLWISHIAVVNALAYRRTGTCLLLSRTRRFFLLFPVSAAFWWTFEYLNRFVGNWHYVGGMEFGPMEYFLFATLQFSTVLPAVLSTRELLLSFPRIEGAFRHWHPLSLKNPRAAAGGILLLSCGGFFAVGIVPDIVFPLIWVAPPLILVCIASLRGEANALSGISAGDWRPFVASSLAALACGVFWEMWNSGSFVKWVYAVPYVDVIHVFEMPLLGYAGYLPFGVLCAEVGDRFLAGGDTGEKYSPPPGNWDRIISR